MLLLCSWWDCHLTRHAPVPESSDTHRYVHVYWMMPLLSRAAVCSAQWLVPDLITLPVWNIQKQCQFHAVWLHAIPQSSDMAVILCPDFICGASHCAFHSEVLLPHHCSSTAHKIIVTENKTVCAHACKHTCIHRHISTNTHTFTQIYSYMTSLGARALAY